MPPRIDLIGKKFGKLTVIEQSPKKSKGKLFWICKCECGETAVISGSNLKFGNSKSCGCYRRERGKEIISNANKANVLHGDTVGQKITQLFSTWRNIKTRCSNPKVKNYQWYGGKGIKVCDEWQMYQSFKNWALANGFKPGLTIDRIKADGDYEPSNCRWITMSENSRRAANERFKRKGHESAAQSVYVDSSQV